MVLLGEIDTEMINKLDDKNIEFSKILFEMKQNLDIYKLIGLNAKEINAKGVGKTFWGIAQKATLRLFIIDVCKIYEKKKRNKLNSIPEILDFIRNNQLSLEDFEPIRQFVGNHSERIPELENYPDVLVEIVDDFVKLNQDPLNAYKTLRNKKLVHAEDVLDLNLENLPSYDKMERLLEFGIDFYVMIHDAYIGARHPVQHKIDNRALVSLQNALKKIGHKNLKIDFVD